MKEEKKEAGEEVAGQDTGEAGEQPSGQAGEEGYPEGSGGYHEDGPACLLEEEDETGWYETELEASGEGMESPPLEGEGHDDRPASPKALAAAAIQARKEREEREQKEEQTRKLSLLAKIQKLDIGEKGKLARNGDKDARSILIKDSNKLVAMAVLANPKITIQEIEVIAASRNVPEEVLREIGKNKDWLKSYTVMLSLLNNPKTPLGVSLTHISKLKTRDLRFLARSKGVPEALRATAKRIAETRKF